MGHFIDSMERMRVHVVSDDETLRCEFSVKDGYRFSQGPSKEPIVIPEPLEEDAAELIKAVRVEYSYELQRIRESRPGRTDTTAPEHLPQRALWLRNEWLRRYRTSLDEIEIHVKGAAKLTQVWLHGDGDVEVLVPNKTRSDITTVLKDLSEAVNVATNKLWRSNVELRRAIDEEIRDLIEETKV